MEVVVALLFFSLCCCPSCESLPADLDELQTSVGEEKSSRLVLLVVCVVLLHVGALVSFTNIILL